MAEHQAGVRDDLETIARISAPMLPKRNEFETKWALSELQNERTTLEIVQQNPDSIQDYQKMKLGIWNIDHPECETSKPAKSARFDAVQSYLEAADCDAYIITEANSALRLPGYFCELSSVSPFRNSRRYYGEPNSYHQVAIYCKQPLVRIESKENINGLLCAVEGFDTIDHIYGNVITIKDQWSKESSKTYSDRLSEQIRAIQHLQMTRTVVGGDFNLKRNWLQKKKAYQQIGTELESSGWRWPTKTQTETVQHVMHSPDLIATFSIEPSVTYNKETKSGLSDHPFVRVSIEVHK